MKKIITGVLIGIFLFVFQAGSFAAEPFSETGSEKEQQTKTESGEESAASQVVDITNLVLDNRNIYEGMEKSYAKGYEPTVKKKKVIIVLPLYEVAPTDIVSITATPDLGKTADSPFVYKNYQKTVTKSVQKINNSDETREVFLVKFELPLQEERSDGVYPVKIKIAYDSAEVTKEKEFITYIQLEASTVKRNDDEVPVQSDDAEISGGAGDGGTMVQSETEKLAEPKIIVESSKQLPETIMAGDEFSLAVTLKNTNKKKDTQNITVTVSSDNAGVILREDSNVFFFEGLGIEKNMELVLDFKTDAKIEAGKYTINLEISYDNSDAVSLTSAGKIDFQVQQKQRIEFESGQFPTEVNAGDSVSMPIQVMNLGRNSIYNVRCIIETPGLSIDHSLFLGNVESGLAAEGELVIFAGMVNQEAATEEERYGRTSGKLILIYEDESANEYREEKEIVTVVNALTIGQDEMKKGETAEDNDITLQLGIGISVVVVMAIICFILGVKKRWQ